MSGVSSKRSEVSSQVSSQRSEVRDQLTEISSQQSLWTLFTLGSVQKPLPNFESRATESGSNLEMSLSV